MKEKLLTQNITYFPSWLCVVARNHCLKKLRSKSKFIFLGEEKAVNKSENSEKEDHLDKYLDKLPEAIERLGEVQRKCIVFFYIHGKSYKEIEKLFGFPFKKIKSSIQHGKKNLYKIIMSDERESV